MIESHLIKILISIGVGYILGNIQTSYILAKLVRQTDIREKGSGNAGASNAVMVLGWWAGVITFLVDVLKGFAAVTVIARLFPDNGDLAILAGAFSIIGHIFPVLLQFKGGKGIATIIGVVFGFDPGIGLVLLCIMGIALLVSRYVVVASLISLILLPAIVFFLGYSTTGVLITIGVSLIGIIKHQENIENLMTGKETSLDAVLPRSKTD